MKVNGMNALTTRPTQASYMRHFNETHREEFNKELFKRDDMDTINALCKVIKSCEKDRYFTLKVLSTRVITDYEEVYNTLRQHVEDRRKKNDKSENIYDFIDLKDSAIMLLEVKYLVRHNGIEKQKIDGVQVDVKNPEQVLTVLIAVPRYVNKYYFRINGVYYIAIMQIADGSTYNNSASNSSKSDNVTQKTMFQPIAMFRILRNLIDYTTNEPVINILYTATIFNNHLNAMYYILAAFGLYQAMAFLGIYCVKVTDTPIEDPDWYCFKKHNLYVSYPRSMKDPMVQSLAVTIYDAIDKKTTINDIYNIHFWLINLGKMYKNASIDKGLFVLDSIDSVLDLITKDDFRLPDSEKKTIYHILRWLMREFVSLRSRDNVDVTYKKVRIPDYYAACYGTKLSTGIHRISDMGKRVTLNAVIKAIYTNPMYLIQQITNQSNLVNYQDMVNDDDATTALKFTYKGIQGLGEDGKAIQPIYRYIDPSHIGILDLDSSPTSDPGMSGMICPMTELYDGKYFSDYQEPNTWYQTWEPDQLKYAFPEGVKNPLVFKEKPEFDSMDRREQVVETSLELTRLRCPLINIKNPSIKYTDIEEQAQKELETPPTIDLFTVIDEEK